MAVSPRADRIRDAEASATDDLVLPFKTERSGVHGHVVRLGSAIDSILSRHEYPEPVSRTLADAVALTAMLGVALKFDGKLTLQTSTDGVLGFLVVHFEAPGQLRAYASFDKERWAIAEAGGHAPAAEGSLLGKGHLAMTIDQVGARDRYQGIVPLDDTSLADAAETYFRQSEQMPTFLRLAVARRFVAGADGAPGTWSWRAGGLLLQYVRQEREIVRREATTEADEQELPGEADDEWQRVRLLASTVEDHELIDPTLNPERLLYRLFHEEGVRVFDKRPVQEHCRCSRERVEVFLRQFDAAEMDDLREPDGGISVKCEFCATSYRFSPDELKR